MIYTLNTPVMVGDLANPITIDAVELASVSFNFEPAYSDAGTAIVSVVLVHRASGYKYNVVFNDAASLTQWANFDGVNNAITKAIFNRLKIAGKIPAGDLK